MFFVTLAAAIVSIGYCSQQANFTAINNVLQQCNETSRGIQVLYTDRKGDEIQVVCQKVNEEYRWKFPDGSLTYGEKFNPVNYCSDIVDNLPNAQDGYYWVMLNTTKPRKVWCDVHTDRGGFMLVGMKDSPESWRVPSSSSPVNPHGPPHWASNLGDAEIQDFGIQVSSNETFDGTQSHWFYRFKRKRQLRNLLTNDKSTGCVRSDPGIGDVKYVKNVRTGSIATSNFKCSIFGPHTYPNLGWARMNYCLNHDCESGYGVIPGPNPFPYGQYGSFSYSVVSSTSGTERNSTSFVGCDDGKCCACFGPKGGRGNYCGPACTAINGGNVTEKAFVWFWVRTRMPKRLRKSFMEAQMINATEKRSRSVADSQTDIVREVEKLEQELKIQLNYTKNLENIMKAQENKISILETKYGDLFNRISAFYPLSCSDLRKRIPSATSGMYILNPQGLVSSPLVQVYCDMSGKNAVGVTQVGHNSESATLVRGYESPGSYRRRIQYYIPMEQIVAIMTGSRYCEQFIKYRCLHSMIWWGHQQQAWWVSRQGRWMNYWGGAAVNSGKCACGMTNKCDGGGKCNCDKNDSYWHEDNGYLTDKNTLPVTELRFGDTGDGKNNEYGYHTLGQLRCWG